MSKTTHWIGGKWVDGEGSRFVSTNPSTQTQIWQGHSAMQTEVTAAVDAAQSALIAWSMLSLQKRIEYIQLFAHQIRQREQQLTQCIAEETGKPLWEAKTETQAVIAKIDISIRAYQERTFDQTITDSTGQNGVRYKPHGVMVVLGPFNFPAHLSNGHIIPALLAGNTIIYKPSELTPKVAELIVQCWAACDLPPGTLNLLQGDKKTAQLLLNENIQGVLFTGSYRAGLAIHQSMSQRPEVILVLEMGGNNPLIIEPVKNQTAAIYHTLLSSFITAGQRCSCARRIFIPSNHWGDQFLQQFIVAASKLSIGAPTQQPEPFMGPVIHLDHAKQHLLAQEKLQQLGGISLLTMQLLKENKPFLTPGIIDMSAVNEVPDEEIFAPFIQVYRYDTFEQALKQANQTQYGLVAGLISDNKDQFDQFYNAIHAGLVYWNRATTGASSLLPFGGVGHSGNHRPSAYFAADYCAYPVASQQQTQINLPETMLPGISLN